MLTIQPATRADWPEIERIYREGIRTGHATFQTEAEVPDGDTWFQSRVPGQVFKGVDDIGRIVAWTSLSLVSSRPVYQGVCEVSLYVSTAEHGQGYGSLMLGNLVSASEAAGIWTLQSSIFPQNEVSIYLHQKHGFRIVGRRERIGRHHGVWRDTIFMERRSPAIL